MSARGAALCLALAAAAGIAEERYELAEYAASGAWEVWCLRDRIDGGVACNLNQVLAYSPHPDFRATILRFRIPAAGELALTIDYEWQTSYERGHLQAADGSRLPLAGCDRPCEITGTRARTAAAMLAAGGTARLRLHDHGVERHDVAVDTRGVSAGLLLLERMQARWRD